MAQMDLIFPAKNNRGTLSALQNGSQLGARYGLILRPADMELLVQRQEEALRSTRRLEFGSGPYEKLIYAFCDSPYLTQTNYAETLGELCELFYRFKSEFDERLSDDELIAKLARLFNGTCHGSLKLTGDRLWQTAHPDKDDTAEAYEENDWEEEYPNDG